MWCVALIVAGPIVLIVYICCTCCILVQLNNNQFRQTPQGGREGGREGGESVIHNSRSKFTQKLVQVSKWTHTHAAWRPPCYMWKRCEFKFRL